MDDLDRFNFDEIDLLSSGLESYQFGSLEDIGLNLPGLGESSAKGLTHEEYRPMITSTAWRKIRNKIVTERKQCEWCESTDRLEVHHLSYDQTPEKPEHDLLLLCLQCHRWAHTFPDFGRSLMAENRWILDFELESRRFKSGLDRLCLSLS